MQRQLTYHWKEPKVARTYRSAVSLHGHTNRSKEGLKFIKEVADGNPLLRAGLAYFGGRAQRESAITMDLKRAYWTPPLTPVAAFEVERDQIERELGLASMVSLTDHDNIEAPLLLHFLPESQNVPVSVEWSVPYLGTVLHIGVHNLPVAQAEAIMAQCAEYTNAPQSHRLRDVLKMLHDMRDVLIVLNHPMWDLGGVGKQRHVQILHDFVGELGMYIHAFELGGLRSWEENQRVLEFAEKWDQLVIGGGDRHGAEPSAVVNLTNADSFADFVYEVRHKRRCHVLFMPQYSEPFVLRLFQSLLDAIREYPDYPVGSRTWPERTFHPDRHHVMQPLATLWDNPPVLVTAFFAAVRLLESAFVRRALLVAFAKPAHQMQFVPNREREVTSQWTSAYASHSSRTPMMKLTAWRTPADNLRRSPKGADSPF